MPRPHVAARPELFTRIDHLLAEFFLHAEAIVAQAGRGHSLAIIRVESSVILECGHDVECEFRLLVVGGVKSFRQLAPKFVNAACPVCHITAILDRIQINYSMRRTTVRELDLRNTARLLTAIADVLDYAQQAERGRETA